MKNKIKLSVRNAAVIMCILAVAEMGASCKKDPCKNTVCPSGTVATESEDGKKCTCEPVVNIETEIVKVGSIEDVKNLKTTVTDLVQNNQHLKNVLISGTGAFVTAPDQFGIWRAFGGLEAEFPNLSLTFEQNGQVVCPRDNNTPLSHAEWKQWWFSADVPLLLGVNPWSGNRWLIAAGELQLFIDDGCDPFSINKEMKDTVDINIGDNVNPDPVQWWLTNSNSTKQTIEIGRQGGKTFYRVYLNSNINISLQDKNTAADIINFGKQYSDTLVKVFYEGKKLSPKVSGIPIDFQYWTGTLNKFPLDANAGVKFTIFCKEEDSWKGEGYNTATTFDIDQTDCTGNDTIKINNETALNAAPAQIAQSIAKPLTKTYVWVNGNFSVHNGTAWETSAAQVFDYIDNQQVTWIAPAGKISAGSDSVRVNDMEILKGLGDKNLLEPNSYAGNNFFYHAGFTGNTLSLIPQGQIMRTDILQSSEGGDVSNPVPSVYEINTQGGANAMGFVTLYDAGWKYDIALQITASDAYFMRVNDKFLNMLESPAGPAVSTAPFRLVSAVNPILALYSANSGSTAVNGL
ncbi:MAG: hypothetical protein FWH36_07335, partial [Lentimicrobiaceae bacterium]|nr:hypothetical protein [Lentimicrobiaceae bacterium]